MTIQNEIDELLIKIGYDIPYHNLNSYRLKIDKYFCEIPSCMQTKLIGEKIYDNIYTYTAKRKSGKTSTIIRLLKEITNSKVIVPNLQMKQVYIKHGIHSHKCNCDNTEFLYKFNNDVTKILFLDEIYVSNEIIHKKYSKYCDLIYRIFTPYEYF